MSDTESLLKITSLLAFFREELSWALKRTGTQTSEETEAYLVHLLDGYSTLNPATSEALGFDKPAAKLLEEAMSSEGDRRVELYRKLGDASLYNCGFFEEHLQRRVGPEYYRRVGRTAYASLGDMMTFKQPGGVFDGIFNELAAKFDGVVEAFRWVGQRRSGDALEDLIQDIDRRDLDTAALIRAGIFASKDKGFA